jgi:hypothetical protein
MRETERRGTIDRRELKAKKTRHLAEHGPRIGTKDGIRRVEKQRESDKGS